MNKLQDVKYRELKVMIPEYLFDDLMQICRKLYGKRNYKLRCYESIVREFINNHTEIKVEPFGRVYRKRRVAKADEHIQSKTITTEL